jgi:hypothetical protein
LAPAGEDFSFTLRGQRESETRLTSIAWRSGLELDQGKLVKQINKFEIFPGFVWGCGQFQDRPGMSSRRG